MTTTLAITTVTRVFNYCGIALPDPNPAYTPEEVKEHYTAVYPELVNASVEGGDFDGTNQAFAFRRGTGTKG
ncbi:PRTRC system protein C [Noviherbaspirillum sp. CPCC 100848]|jgi:PRTRC genetic system protein C|uniref:PRTRC system protein C n=1 Tax=Noviherbaspirillum album TaxID=3080276 RepID=A0ABU6J3W6_9BURK|nr:PRTRC system protein C [Noviherbaspirillum sp. CPCC 100848]MEC4718309.1 PRTRC system protein C [Noviherbaspirillum sp. CPCC 100848]